MKNIIFLALFFLTGCASFDESSRSTIPSEMVLENGMKLCASNNGKQLCILADGYTKRIITWEGEVRSINTVPRKERWHGTLGLVSPKPPNNLWKNQNGITRVLYEEAQIKYENVENALKGLNFPEDDGWNVVYNDTGVLIMWHKTVLPDHNVLDLMLFQFIINGKKPVSLPGSKNDHVTVSYNQ